MIKQLLIIGLAAIMFVGVWVLVIIQFNDEPDPVSLNYSTTIESSNERAFDFPDTIKKTPTKEEDSNPIEKNQQSENKVIDLRDYDFSDVSTDEGVPIGAILDKLELE